MNITQRLMNHLRNESLEMTHFCSDNRQLWSHFLKMIFVVLFYNIVSILLTYVLVYKNIPLKSDRVEALIFCSSLK